MFVVVLLRLCLQSCACCCGPFAAIRRRPGLRAAQPACVKQLDGDNFVYVTRTRFAPPPPLAMGSRAQIYPWIYYNIQMCICGSMDL